MKVDALIVGAGVSGLAVAHGLACRGRRVLVLERQARAGGNAVSERIGGFLMEHGPTSLNAAHPGATTWSRDLGLDAQHLDLRAGARRRYLTAGDRLRGISAGGFDLLTSDYLSLGARLRMMAEACVPSRPPVGEETVLEFFGRRFGREFAERVMAPFVAGMFAGDAARLAVGAVFPALVDMERRYGSIIRGVIQSRLRGERMPVPRLFSYRNGVGALPGALAAGLNRQVRTGVAVRRIVARRDGFRVYEAGGGAIDASSVVVATQAHVAAGLLDGLDRAAAEAAAAIEAPPIAVVFLGYRRGQVAHALDGIGYLNPGSERRALSGALFCSTMFDGRASGGHVALAAYIGGARAPGLARRPARELTDLARKEFADLLGARGRPVLSRVRHWPRGLPQYTLGHRARAAIVSGVSERLPGLYLTGNYLEGLSVAACIEQAVDTARRVDRFLLGVTAESPPAPLNRQAAD